MKNTNIITRMNAEKKLSWQEFYKETLSTKKFLKRIICNLEMIVLIIKHMPPSVVEIGTGTGALSAFISWFLPLVIAIDNDKEVLKKAKINCRTFGRKVHLVVADAFCLPFKNDSVSLCFSQGFFEHFSNKQINILLNEQIRVARNEILFNIPSDRYPVKPFGNERLSPPEKWRKIIKSSLSIKSVNIKIRYCRIDAEAFKYFIIKRKWHGFFGILGVIKKFR